jgi:[protein-PII] uridylyltransferase
VNIDHLKRGSLKPNGTVPLVSTGALREARAALIGDTSLRGIAFCRAYAKAADEWLVELATKAIGSARGSVALLAVGGYGRGELSPYSDLDLLLVHDSLRGIDKVADQLWYPIWDEGIHLDHSVRTPKEVFAVGAEDLRVALGLLDARLIFGDTSFAARITDQVRELWSGEWGDRYLPELESQMTIRHEQHGDLADLLEPDLKEAHGGLRDVNALEAVRWAFPEVSRFTDFDEVFAARDVLLQARVALHINAGRALDRLLLQEQDQVAVLAGEDDADVLMRNISAAARTVARASDASWRRRGHWRQFGGLSPEPPRSLGDGIELYDGEVRLAAGAPVSSDVTLTMRLAAAAAREDCPVALETLSRLASESPAIPTPWPGALRRAFVSLLAEGDGLVSVVESLEDFGLVSRHLPEWSHVRSYHQRNAYHRFTVDRHLLETVRNARSAAGDVAHPDLLLLGALFHDIGKGLPGDHTEVGTELAQSIGPRIGLSDADAATLVLLVRHHLLLADVATRRDLDDPATIRYVAAAVGDEQTLELLAALSRADGLSTGPSAWGPWKAQLVEELTRRARSALQGHDVVVEPRRYIEILAAARESGLVVRREGDWVIVGAVDQPGLLAAITGALALLGIDIRSADLLSDEGVAVDRFFCTPGARDWPHDDAMADAIADALSEPDRLWRRLAERAAHYSTKPRSAQRVQPVARLIPAASDAATVVEIVALDEIGLLSRIAHAVSEAGLDIGAARLSTVGEVAIDTFYLRGATGSPLSPSEVDDLITSLNGVVRSPD